MRRLSGHVYATTYPGVGLGVVAEWVSHNQRGGALEMVLALPFVTLNAELIVSPPNPRKNAPLVDPHASGRRELRRH